MTALRILILCISAALICASVRTLHPQIASAVALAAGIGALMLSASDLSAISQTMQALETYANQSGMRQNHLLKICGIAFIAELAADICRDSNEAALAHRIDAGVKLGIVVSALPSAVEILENIAVFLE